MTHLFLSLFFFFLFFLDPPTTTTTINFLKTNNHTTTTDYSSLLESKLSIFVEKHDMTAHTFYDQLHEAQTSDPMAGQIIQYLLGATEYRRFVDLLIDRKMFHFGMGGPIGVAVGTDGSVVTASEGKQQSGGAGSDSSSSRNGDRGGSSKEASGGGENVGETAEAQSFGRKSSDDNVLTEGGKEADATESSSARKK